MPGEIEVRPRAKSYELEMAVIDPNPQKGETSYWLPNSPQFYNRPIEGVTSCNSGPKFLPSSVSCFLTNGYRWYRDTCNNAEIALPELLDLDDLVTYACASDAFIKQTVDTHRKGRAIQVHKGVFSTNSESPVGFHENYNVRRFDSYSREELAQYLTPFLIGRTLFNGLGRAEEVEGRPVIVAAQRARFVDAPIKLAATDNKSKPWIINRDEDFNSDPQQKGDSLRLQVAGGDPSISPDGTYFTFGTTSIVIRLWENHVVSRLKMAPSLVGYNSRKAALDYDGTTALEVEVGGQVKELRAIDILDKYLEMALDHVDKGIFSSDEVVFLDYWQKVSAKYHADPMSLYNYFDAFCKRWLAKEKGLTTIEQLQKLDMLYDAVTGVRHKKTGDTQAIHHGIGIDLRNKGFYHYRLDNDRIERAIKHAPEDTRARHRAEIISALRKIPDSESEKWADWHRESVSVKNADGLYVGKTVVRLFDVYGDLPDHEQRNKEKILALAA